MKAIILAPLAIGISIFSFAKAEADTLTIDMLTKLTRAYSSDIAQIATGDKVTWLPMGKGNNVDVKNGLAGIKFLKNPKHPKNSQ